MLHPAAGEPPNKGHFGDDINSANLFFAERFFSLGVSKCIVVIPLYSSINLFRLKPAWLSKQTFPSTYFTCSLFTSTGGKFAQEASLYII